MAKTIIKEEVGFYDSIAQNAKMRDELSKEKLPDTIFGSFKKMFSEKLSLLTRLGLMTVLFCLPIIIWSTMVTFIELPVNYTLPYSGNIGPSFGYFDYAVTLGNYLEYQNALLFYSVLIVGIVIASIAVGGMFYAARKLLWSPEPPKMFASFFKGIKYTWKTAILAGILGGGAFFLMVFNFYVYDAYVIATAWKVIGIIASIAFFIFVACFCLYLVSLSATYEMSMSQYILSALKLTVGRWFPNLFMVIFASLVGVVCFLLVTYFSTFATMINCILFFYGIFYSVAVVTANTHRQFDRYINVTDGSVKVAQVYTKRESTDEKADSEKQKPVKFTNPKKGKKKPADVSANKSSALPENIKGGENGLDEDLSVYLDEDED